MSASSGPSHDARCGGRDGVAPVAGKPPPAGALAGPHARSAHTRRRGDFGRSAGREYRLRVRRPDASGRGRCFGHARDVAKRNLASAGGGARGTRGPGGRSGGSVSGLVTSLPPRAPASFVTQCGRTAYQARTARRGSDRDNCATWAAPGAVRYHRSPRRPAARGARHRAGPASLAAALRPRPSLRCAASPRLAAHPYRRDRGGRRRDPHLFARWQLAVFSRWDGRPLALG